MQSDNWLPIPGFDGWYEVSDTGIVRSVERVIPVNTGRTKPYTITCKSKVLKPVTSHGYLTVSLWKQHVLKVEKIGTLVMLAFIGPRPSGLYVCHMDGDPRNNRLGNLYYGTPVENSADKMKHGTHVQGEDIPWSKLTEEDVRFIRSQRGVVPQSQLAEMFDVGQGHISRVQSGKEWSHVQ